MIKKTSISILTKAPEPGKVKTRFKLAGLEAAKIYSSFLKKIHATISASNFESLWFLDGDISYLDLEIEASALYIQEGESLSDRIKHAFNISRELGFNNTIIIGGDSPEIDKKDFTETARLLDENEYQVVLGPSFDGGIYLLGQCLTANENYLNDMIWSTESVYDNLRLNLDDQSIRYRSQEPKYDIDTHEDYIEYLKRVRY